MHSTFFRRSSRLAKHLSDSSALSKQYITSTRSIQQSCVRSFSNTFASRQGAAAQTSTATSPTATGSRSTPASSEALRSLTAGLADPPPVLDENEKQVDWTRSYHGLSSEAFTEEQAAILQQEIDSQDIEVKPDGIVYLPEIKYRRILNKAFKPGGWGLAPRGETIITQKLVTREYALVAGGRLISIARGEQQYFDPDGIPTATEGCKSNALMRCCKDLGIASELWDPRFIRAFLKEHARETIVEHAITKKRRKHWMRKDDVIRPPLKEITDPIRTVSTPPPRQAPATAVKK